MQVLGIETSCDETAAAVVSDDGRVASDLVHSQVSVHAPYGGVVPELASRDHLRNVRPVIHAALEQAGLRLADLDGIAVTCRPGLSGALLVGVQAARGLAWASGKPIVGVDHLVGHLLAAFLQFPNKPETPRPRYPFVALLASGGHTALYRVDGAQIDQVHELGATRDDAAGEAFDKVAKLLGLGYPGGPVVDRLAKEGNPERIVFAQPMRRRSSLEFSFSGLKSDVARWVREHGQPGDDQTLRDVCAAFQRCVVDTLVRKSIRAAQSEGVSDLVLAGGVAANRELRERATDAGAAAGIRVVVPGLRACTDNAAMIAYAGTVRLLRGEDDRGVIEVSPRTALRRLTRKGRGLRAD
ncbi:MAG TPA: tRNA (adenosine(37)-N6)-threonylcarbamoyltransferase complex transferase subunit TsaD [Polyangiaceae bacterium]